MYQTASPPSRQASSGRLSSIFRLLFVAWALAPFAQPALSQLSATERAYLQALYTSTAGASWATSTNWNGPAGFECTPTNWYGVNCINTPAWVVDALHLATNNLVGPLPSNLSDLSSLKTISMGTNLISGSFPSLSALPGIRAVSMPTNQLTGSLPILTGLTNLFLFDFFDNQLTGSIPSLAAPTMLNSFNVGKNQLTGSLPSLNGLGNLQFFQAGQNQLTGGLPTLSGVGLSALQLFQVPSNQLTGSIPSLAGLATLQNFDVRFNQLTGGLPPLSGIGLSAIEFLYFDGNPLGGTIPSLNGLGTLRVFSAANNQLTGSLPTLSGVGLTGLSSLFLSTNQLTGGIPSLSGLTNLSNLYLQNNQLTGNLPSLAGLTSLSRVNFSNNQLSGNLPNLTGFTGMLTFGVASNKLTGDLDVTGIGTLTGLPAGELDLRWNGFYSATNNAVLIAFLNSKQLGGNWQSTQTIPPTGIGLVPVAGPGAQVTWTPIAYTADTGYYEVLYSTTPGGPYTAFPTVTANKSASSLVVWPLSAPQNYCFVVRTVTNPHANNTNTVVSDLSGEVCVTTPVELMRFTAE